jgi:hypothetical protein
MVKAKSKIYKASTRKTIRELYVKKKKPKWYGSSQRASGWNPFDSVD